jgi:hypothetical protein
MLEAVVPLVGRPNKRFSKPFYVVLASQQKTAGSFAALTYQYNGMWRGRRYRIKQVAPVIFEEPNEIVVVTVYTFFSDRTEHENYIRS